MNSAPTCDFYFGRLQWPFIQFLFGRPSRADAGPEVVGRPFRIVIKFDIPRSIRSFLSTTQHADSLFLLRVAVQSGDGPGAAAAV